MSTGNTSPEHEKFLLDHEKLSWLHFIGTQEFGKVSIIFCLCFILFL